MDGPSRRSVLEGGAVAVVAGVAGYVAYGLRPPGDSPRASGYPGGGAAAESGGSAGPGGTGGRGVLAPLADVPVGGGVVVSSAAVVLTRDAAGHVHGFSAVCTHQGCLVSSVQDGRIGCGCHGSEFDATTGAVVQGPATAPLPPVAVAVEGDAVVAT